MRLYTDTSDFDLITPDGKIVSLERKSDSLVSAVIVIDHIPSKFIGFTIDKELIIFNIKSTLAQLGVDGKAAEIELDLRTLSARILVDIIAIGPVGREMLSLITVGCYIGKLFAMDDRRRVRDPIYLGRMFGRADRWNNPLLSLGGYHGSSDLILDKVDGRCIAYLTLQKGVVNYDSTIYGFLPTVAKALKKEMGLRNFLQLHQELDPQEPKIVAEGELLLVKTAPLHVRTVFAKVVNEYLPPGFCHTSASVLEPHTQASGDIYEFYGNSLLEISDIPLEFYTLEPYREFVFFSDRDQLQSALEDPKVLFKAFGTAPENPELRTAVFIVKSDQLLNLKAKDWVVKETRFQDFPESMSTTRQALIVDRYIEQQPSYPILKQIEDGVITSQGILLSRYFPSPLMKRMYLSDHVQRGLKGIYFTTPSQSHGTFFSNEDRAFLHDLYVCGIPAYWLDDTTGKILKYVQQPGRDSGMFVPIEKVQDFMRATLFGIYGSNLVSGEFENELYELMKELLKMRTEFNHALLSVNKPIAFVTGGGPGAMEVGNRVAKNLGILSCANLVDFRARPKAVVNEQRQNHYVEAKMTYRLDRLVERQAEFNLDFPIFVKGGIGTDFEFYLEQVRRKVGSVTLTPILLFGTKEYWKEKITSNFQANVRNGTIVGSEWISNCFYVVSTAHEGIEVYRRYFSNTLEIGPQGPIFEEGFSSLK